jgi:3-dehydroquinate synthase
VRLVRLPPTTLAQGDAGIGVKNGINAFGKKNFLGVFAPPWAVINDERFLETLSDRDWRAGMVEAVKVALLKDAPFFARLHDDATRLRERDTAAGRHAVRRSGQLHFAHITQGGDPFEVRTARPLDFGHWSAHKLEQLTEFSLRHGEAVAIGIALDVRYARAIGMLEPRDADAILDCMRTIGFRLYDDALTETHAVLEGLEEFREHLGGELTITLLEGIGRPVDVHEIDRAKMRNAMEALAADA